MATPRWQVTHSTATAPLPLLPVAAWILVLRSRVMAIMARAISFLGSVNPLPRGAVWQYSQVTPKACEMDCMVAMRSGVGWACARDRAVTAAIAPYFIGKI